MGLNRFNCNCSYLSPTHQDIDILLFILYCNIIFFVIINLDYTNYEPVD